MKNLRNVLIAILVLVYLAGVLGCDSSSKSDSPCKKKCSAKPPKGAIVLFDGRDYSQWQGKRGGPVKWNIVEGAMEVVPETGDIVTKQKFGDCKLHVEFNVPQMAPDVKGQKRGNSGIYLQNRYEIQILDSYGLKSTNMDCGAIFWVKAPDKNVCKKPGEWQSYDITFRAPRYQGTGKNAKKIENARFTVYQNGVLIHENAEVPKHTAAGAKEAPGPGPIMLQDHNNKMRFRNIWIVPL